MSNAVLAHHHLYDKQGGGIAGTATSGPQRTFRRQHKVDAHVQPLLQEGSNLAVCTGARPAAGTGVMRARQGGASSAGRLGQQACFPLDPA